jgi:hypothetical protein
VPRAIRAYFDVSSIPNQITNKGRRAIFGIGKIAATSGTRPALANENNPIIMPTHIPNEQPINEPTTNLVKEGAKCLNNNPVSQSSMSVQNTSDGIGMVKLVIILARVNSSSIKISDTNTNKPTQARGFGE